MLMILARLVRSESFWAVVKVRSPHISPEVCYIIARRLNGRLNALNGSNGSGWARCAILLNGLLNGGGCMGPIS